MFFSLQKTCFSIIWQFKDFSKVTHSLSQSFWTTYLTTGLIVNKEWEKDKGSRLVPGLENQRIECDLPFEEGTLQSLYLKYTVKIHGCFSTLKDLQMQPHELHPAQDLESHSRLSTALRAVFSGQRQSFKLSKLIFQQHKCRDGAA